MAIYGFHATPRVVREPQINYPRADQFDDPYEGMHSPKAIAFMREHDSKLKEKRSGASRPVHCN